MPEILALGEPMVEFAGEQPGRLGTARTFRLGFGGDTSNFIVTAARLGWTTGYITRVGGDEFGRALRDLWCAEGVDVSRVVVEPDGFTGIYFITFRTEGGHDFTYQRTGSAASHMTPSDLDAVYLRSARVFHASGISQAISESCRATVEAAIAMAKAGGGAFSYDLNIRPQLWPPPMARAVVEATIPRADIVFLSTEDAIHLYGDEAADAIIARILAKGPGVVVMKQGAAGCEIASAEGSRIRVPGFAVKTVDTTGAGDAFAAAFVAEWLRDAPLEQAGRFANAVGALTTTGLGAVAPIPTRPQVEAFLATRSQPAPG